MNTYFFTREQFVDRPVAGVFSFFADARNLEFITPPWLRFHITTAGPIRMERGARVDYRIRLRGVPVRWTSEILEWSPPYRFVDVQVRGPYRLWEHTHEFFEVAGGTLVRDEVRYALPMGRLGEIAVRRFVAKDVARIFEYRRDALASRLARDARPLTTAPHEPPLRSRRP
ncbi:MAG TPA: SRPBCC family protein [Candidatus Krumholzibacteria bacterium]|nr:SRPBCC family protein [Candidatus Krumholzibacteria bacterium]